MVLAGIVVIQWRREHALEAQLKQVRDEAGMLELRLAEETTRAEGLARDTGLLKDAVTSTQAAMEQAQGDLAKRDAEATALREEVEKGRLGLEEAAKRVVQWQEAVAARDRRITELEKSLQEARARLDEAIGRLKNARER